MSIPFTYAQLLTDSPKGSPPALVADAVPEGDFVVAPVGKATIRVRHTAVALLALSSPNALWSVGVDRKS